MSILRSEANKDALIEQHYPAFSSLMEQQGRPLPFHIKKEFDGFLKCGRLEHGFIRVQCTSCHKDGLVAFSCKHRGFCPSCGARRSISIPQAAFESVAR